jgi:hypothetical protein
MAQYAIFLYLPPESEDGSEAAPEELAAHDRHRVELEASGNLVGAFALESPDTTTSLRGDVLTDGPYLEAKEVIGGFYVVEAPDLDAALEIARGNPILVQGGGLEVRPVAY